MKLTYFHCDKCGMSYACKAKNEPTETCPICKSEEITTGLSLRDLFEMPVSEYGFEDAIDYVYRHAKASIELGEKFVELG